MWYSERWSPKARFFRPVRKSVGDELQERGIAPRQRVTQGDASPDHVGRAGDDGATTDGDAGGVVLGSGGGPSRRVTPAARAGGSTTSGLRPVTAAILTVHLDLQTQTLGDLDGLIAGTRRRRG